MATTVVSTPTTTDSPNVTTSPRNEVTLSPMSQISAATSSSSSSPFELGDEDTYTRFQQTYVPFDNQTSTVKEHHTKTTAPETTTEEDTNSVNSSTWWDLFLSLYLPVLLVWVRRSMFGTANLFRSLVLGHCLRYLFSNLSGWVTEKSPLWLHPILLSSCAGGISSSGTSGNVAAAHSVVGSVASKVDPHAWPPPALTALAILTILALVVHPDGFTWIMLGKLRDAAVSLLQSSMTCWGVLIQDFGLLPTLAASATFATLVFLILIMHRTLSPRNNTNKSNMQDSGYSRRNSNSKRTPASSPEKKKRKRKGHARHRGGTRIKHGGGNSSSGNNAKQLSPASSCPSKSPSTPQPSSESAIAASPPIVLEKTPQNDLKSLELPRLSMESNPVMLLSSLSSVSSPSKSLSQDPTVTNTSRSATSNRSTSKPISNNATKNRGRMPSTSTLETSALSDDQSCGSTSVRSIPSSIVSSSTQSLGEQSSGEKGRSRKKKKNHQLQQASGINGSPSSTNPSNRRQPQQHNKRNVGGNKSKPSLNKSSDVIPVSSRWDALKPIPNSHTNNTHQNQYHHNNHYHNSNTSYHQQRSNGRRGGNNCQRKGRGASHGGSETPPAVSISGPTRNTPSPLTMPTVATAATASNSACILDSLMWQASAASASSRTRSSPESILLPSHAVANRNNITNATLASTLPPPPPGLGPLPFLGGARAGSIGSSIALQPSEEQNCNNALNSTTVASPLILPAAFDCSPLSTSSSPPDNHSFSPANGAGWNGGMLTSSASGSLELHNVLGGASSNLSSSHCVSRFHSYSSAAVATGSIPFGGGVPASTVKENPFAQDDNHHHMTAVKDDYDSQIEADLQELGGQMAGSILDF